jgi:hypothetical protein
MSLNPIPLANLDEHIVSHDTQQTLRLSSLLPHQNLRNIALIASHNPLGRLKHDIEKIGIAIATALISTSFPPELVVALANLGSFSRYCQLLEQLLQ